MKSLSFASFVQVDEIGGIDHDLSAGETPYILMDYIPGISLFDYIEKLYKDNASMDPLIKFKIIYGIVYSMAYLHLNGRVHRDIKPSNIFLDHHFHPHLGDFGDITNKTNTGHLHGTMYYLPPEAYQPGGGEIPCGPEYDIYEFGATLFHIITYEWPYDDKDKDIDVLKEYISKGILDDRFEPGNPEGNVISEDDRELYQLARMCMAFDKTQRPTSDQLIKWIADGASKKLTKQQFNLFATYANRLTNTIPIHYGTFNNCKVAIEKGYAFCSKTLEVIAKELNLENKEKDPLEQLNETFQKYINKSETRVPSKSRHPTQDRSRFPSTM